MSNNKVLKAIKDLEELAKKEGLDFFPTIFEFVDRAIMLDACSYGLPVRARHWSYGRSYQQQKIYGEMGLSKVYEVVFNNNPAYAFLLDTNRDIDNIMVGAHVYGHCHFFKNNVMFKGSDRSMVYRAAERATRVDQYIEQYGIDAVEHLMNIAFSLDNHIDWHKGIHRKKYSGRKVIKKVRKKDEFEDLLNFGKKAPKRSVTKRVYGNKLPPHPEKDILWFLINYAPLEDWERDILSIIREESYYFYPIVMTKILNEGFACVLPDTLVYTDSGIVKMSDLVENLGTINDGESNRKVIHSGVFENRDTYKIVTKRGLELTGSNNHRIMLEDDQWRCLDELKIGDNIKISGGNNLWNKNYKFVSFGSEKAKSIEQLCKENNISCSSYYRSVNKEFVKKEISTKINNIKREIEKEKLLEHTSPMGNRNSVVLENHKVDDDFAAFIGYLIGDGHVSKKGRQIGLTSGDKEQIEHFCELSNSIFGRKPNIRFDKSSGNGRWRSVVYSKDIIDLLVKEFGFKTGPCANKKEIPSIILQSPKPVMSSFLRSYFDCDACASKTQGVILSTSSDKLAEQVQTVLLNYGILSTRKKATDGCWQLRITGSSAKLFSKEIGFRLDRKQNKLNSYIESHKWFKEEKWSDEIVEIEYCGKQDVYDISVEKTHRYAAAGFINHNSFWHAELMYKYDNLSEQEYMEFARTHSGVVNPGSPFNINPYYLGFKVLTDIRERWDELYKKGKSDINGIQKVLQVAKEEDDASFLRNYLTKELAAKLGLFNYGYKLYRDPNEKEEDLTEEHGIIELKDRELDKIIDNIIRPTVNYGAPLIKIVESDNDVLVLKHDDSFGPLDQKYAEKTMEYIYELWGEPIEIHTYRHGGAKVTYYFDEGGFDVVS